MREVGGRLVVTSETVEVVAVRDAPLRHSSIASKSDQPLLETPRSVTVIDRQVLDDLQAINIAQAHDYAVGVTPIDQRGPASSRGFPVDFYDLRRDGLRTYSWSVREPAAVDRVQYLRGSASLLYGDGSPGGLVNMVLKKPLPLAERHVSVSGGSQGFGRFEADLTGPLNAGRSMRYRAVAAGEWLEGSFDNDERRLTLLPTAAIDLSARATLTVDTELYWQRGRNYRHALPATTATGRGDFDGIFWDLSVGGADTGWTGSNVSPGARVDVAIGGTTSIHAATRYTRITGDLDLEALASVTPDGSRINRFHYREISSWDEYQSDAFVSSTLRTGRIEHRVVAGLEAGFSVADTLLGTGPAAPLDIAVRQYLPSPPVTVLSPTHYDVGRLGVYAVDQVRLTRALTIVPGLRWSRLTIDVDAPAAPTSADDDHSEVTPSIGLLVLPTDRLGIYATFSGGFEPPTPGQYRQDGTPLDLSRHSLGEAGVKVELGPQRVLASAAVFHIRRTNVPEFDPSGFYRQIGEATSSGVELELAGKLAGPLTVLGGYAYTVTEITADTAGFEGRALPNAPGHKANLWMRYRVGPAIPGNLVLSAGVVHVSDRFTARNNAVVAPAYTRFDASAEASIVPGRFGVSMNAYNLTDCRYVTAGAGTNLFAGPSRRLALRLTTRF